MHGSSGLLRALKIVHYLPAFGYEPIVLTAHPRAYEMIDRSLLHQIPDGTRVYRIFALDTKKHLGVNGAYFHFLALPDRWASWIPFAVAKGLSLVFSQNVDIVFSTAPIPSTHVIGFLVSKLTKKPWIADFRDPLYGSFSPFTKMESWFRKKIESLTISKASKIIVTTPGMRSLFMQRYPLTKPEKYEIIYNGFDEADFANVIAKEKSKGKLRMIYAGLLDKQFRNPIPFFLGLKKALNRVNHLALRVDFYGTENAAYFEVHVQKLALDRIVRFHPSIPYHEVLQELAASDILLLFQGKSFNAQIPAKVFEYFRIGKPILAFTPADGETGKIIAKFQAGYVVSDDDPVEIEEVVLRCINTLKKGKNLPRISAEEASQFSRISQTNFLARIFDSFIKA